MAIQALVAAAIPFIKGFFSGPPMPRTINPATGRYYPFTEQSLINAGVMGAGLMAVPAVPPVGGEQMVSSGWFGDVLDFASGFIQHPRDEAIAEELGGFIGEAIFGGGQQSAQSPVPSDRLYQLQTRTRNLSCWQNDRGYNRRQVRLVKVPDPGSPRGWSYTTETYCRPKRMNPLNPKALARAGRRVGSFCRIASGMQKMLEKAIKKGSRGKSRSTTYRCPPSKRC